jgi:hypothetical protein
MSIIEVIAIEDGKIPVGLAEEDIDEVSGDWLIGERTGDLAVLGPFVFTYLVWVHKTLGRRG